MNPDDKKKDPGKPQERPKVHCNFCGKDGLEVRRLFAGPGVYICDECVQLAVDVFSEEDEARRAENLYPQN